MKENEKNVKQNKKTELVETYPGYGLMEEGG